jgi:hypothetical protein
MSSILNDVVPFDECEVYSWYPEPEYDPHLQSDDNDESDDGIDEMFEEQEEQTETMADGMDVDEPAWGQAGMELDDAPGSSNGASRRKRQQPELMAPPMEHANSSERLRKLLWSANYFFYSR